jgi:hypothetical protein
MTPKAVRTVRSVAGLVADGVRSIVSPAALVTDKAAETPATVEQVEAPEPAGLFTEDEMPPVVEIERAALSFDLAADNARRADRAKRAAKKTLDRLPAGRYGNWLVERVTSNRQTADLDQIRAIFKANGLGQVPMKSNAPSLRVRRAELGAPATAAEPAVLAAV